MKDTVVIRGFLLFQIFKVFFSSCNKREPPIMNLNNLPSDKYLLNVNKELIETTSVNSV